MSDAIALGPLLLPLPLLLLAAATVATLALGRWLAGPARAGVVTALWRTLLVAVLLARLAFVYEYRSLYLAAPLTILDVRDGGWNPAFGVLGAWLFAVHRTRRAPALRRPLRWSLALGTAVFVIGTAVLSFRPTLGRPLPALAFESLAGPAVPLHGFLGKPTVVNLWATWCPPCVHEMPVLHAAQVERPDVHFVFLNQGEARETVARWLGGQGLQLRHVLLDPRRQASAVFQQQGYPTTLFFNARGELVATRVGQLSAATLDERLRRATR